MEVGVETPGGSDGNRRIGAELRDRRGAIGYVLGLNHFATDGYRDHSRAERTVLKGKYHVPECRRCTAPRRGMVGARSAAGALARRSRADLDGRDVPRRFLCAATPCAVPNVPVAANTRIPGAPRTSAHAALQWGSGAGWQARLQAQHVGAVQVNTTDDERAPAYTVFGVSTDYGFRRDDGDGRVFLAIGNLSDRHHAGSVIVNEGNRRYYEPAPARNVTVGFEWRVRAASR